MVRASRQGFKSVVSFMVALSLFPGCAASTVLSRPRKKNLDALMPGTSMGLVHAELGAPVSSEQNKESGDTTEVYIFNKGVSTGWKVTRGMFHIAADVFTLCLWEFVAWPAESVARDKRTTMEIVFNKDEKIKTVNEVQN